MTFTYRVFYEDDSLCSYGKIKSKLVRAKSPEQAMKRFRQKYQKEKAVHDERKAQEYQKAKVRNGINNQRGVAIARTTRKKSWYSKYKNHGRG